MRSSHPAAAILLLIVLLTACGSAGNGTEQVPPDTDAEGTEATGPVSDQATGEAADAPDPAGDGGPAVVASTSWAGALATAAGATDVTVVAPADLPHPPDYDPRPSDLAAVAQADYVLYAGFEGFASRLTEVAGDEDLELVQVELVNTPDVIRAEVTRLAELFDTEEDAAQWLEAFDAEYDRLREDLAARLPADAPQAVAHVFMTPWVEFAGMELAGTWGPPPPSPSELAEFTALAPDFVFANAHTSTGPVLPDLPAAEIATVNFPGQDLDLLAVFAENHRRIADALDAAR